MTEVNSNNGNETKSHSISHGTYSDLIIFSLVAKYQNISMTFITGFFQFQFQFFKKARCKKQQQQKKSLTLIF